MTVKLKFKELEIMYTQIKRTNGGEKNNTPRTFTFPHKGENQCAHTPAPTYTHTHTHTHTNTHTQAHIHVRTHTEYSVLGGLA